jgi:hypothetical protein
MKHGVRLDERDEKSGETKRSMEHGERQLATDSGQQAEKRRQRTEGVWFIRELGNWKISQTDVF